MGYLSVTSQFSSRNFQQRLPYFNLKGSAPDVQFNLVGGAVAQCVEIVRLNGAFCQTHCAVLRIWIGGLQLRKPDLRRERLGFEFKIANALVCASHECFAKWGGQLAGPDGQTVTFLRDFRGRHRFELHRELIQGGLAFIADLQACLLRRLALVE